MNLLNVFLNLLNAQSGIGWHPADALEVLPKAGVGMLVIFVIIGVIILATALLGKLSSKRKDEDK